MNNGLVVLHEANSWCFVLQLPTMPTPAYTFSGKHDATKRSYTILPGPGSYSPEKVCQTVVCQIRPCSRVLLLCPASHKHFLGTPSFLGFPVFACNSTNVLDSHYWSETRPNTDFLLWRGKTGTWEMFHNTSEMFIDTTNVDFGFVRCVGIPKWQVLAWTALERFSRTTFITSQGITNLYPLVVVFCEHLTGDMKRFSGSSFWFSSHPNLCFVVDKLKRLILMYSYR